MEEDKPKASNFKMTLKWESEGIRQKLTQLSKKLFSELAPKQVEELSAELDLIHKGCEEQVKVWRELEKRSFDLLRTANTTKGLRA